MKRAATIRQYLRNSEYRDGLTSRQLAVLCGTSYWNINDTLKTMPDAYIDRWTKERQGPGRYAAVWCVVVPPENCPPPSKG